MFLTSITGKSQSKYSGHIAKSPITVIMYLYNNGDCYAYYTYNELDTPIKIEGNLKKGTLLFSEKDENEKVIASLVFDNFNENEDIIHGKWIRSDKKNTYSITLKKDFEISYGKGPEWNSRELLQSKTTKNHYFKTIISKREDLAHAKIVGIEIFEKKTDRLLQTIPLDCQLLAMDNVKVADYNFDGIEDFSVLETVSHHGPNTTSIYILRDPNSEKYTVSSFKGYSLIFNNDLKVIYETFQNFPDRNQIKTTYKVVHDQMVRIEKECLKYDYNKNQLITIKCK